MTKDTHNPQAVTAYIEAIEHPLKNVVKDLRQVILDAHESIGEQIKWNSPAFFYTGEMEVFNAKEYKRDLAVFHLRKKDHILIVFPTGALIPDDSGILEGDYTDGRRMVTIKSAEELKEKKDKLQRVIREWIAFTGK